MAYYTNIQPCCRNDCGVLVPFVANGTYTGGGKKIIPFKLYGSTSCGIPIARVLQGNLEGLVERDDMAELNPPVNSIRLKIEVSRPPRHHPSHLICVDSCLAT